MSLVKLRIFIKAGEISDEIAAIVEPWHVGHQRTIGEQIVRAADSISNNIAEGYGRASTGERIQFLMYSDGSIAETRNCLHRALARGLIDHDTNARLQQKLLSLSISVVEFANAILNRDLSYSGPFRGRIAKRRAWLVNKLVTKEADDSAEKNI